MTYVDNLSDAVVDMLDFDKNISNLSKLTGVRRESLSMLINKKRKQIAICDLFKLLEHGMELNTTEFFIAMIKREKESGSFKGGD